MRVIAAAALAILGCGPPPVVWAPSQIVVDVQFDWRGNEFVTYCVLDGSKITTACSSFYLGVAQAVREAR